MSREKPATAIPSPETAAWPAVSPLRLARLAGLGVLQAATSLAAALLMRSGFERLAAPSSGGADGIGGIALGLVGLALLAALTRHLEAVESEQLGQNYVHELRLRMFRRILPRAPAGELPCSQGALLVRFSGDLAALRRWIAQGLARLLVNGMAIVSLLVALAFLEPAIALVLALALTAAAVPAVAAARRFRASARRLRRSRARLAAYTHDRIRAAATVLAFGRLRRESNRFRRLSARVCERAIARARESGRLRALSEFSYLASLALLLGAGFLAVRRHWSSAGDLVAVLVLVGMFAPRLRQLGRLWEYWNNAAVAREKLGGLLGLPEPRQGRKRLPAAQPRPAGVLELRGLRHGRRIRGIDARLEGGRRAALLGANGSGKSSLLLLVAGVLRPDRGRALLDGVDIHAMRPASRRRAVALVADSVPLLRDTLRSNLSYGRDGIPPAELDLMIEQAGLASLVRRLPQGLDTPLRDPARELSAGERMRLLLARALLARPRLLLLDEPETALDAEGMRWIKNVLRHFEGSVLFATHHPGLAGHADIRWRLVEGRLEEPAGDPLPVTPGMTPKLRMLVSGECR